MTDNREPNKTVETEVKKHIQRNPEQYQEEHHKHLFKEEEIKNLSMSMRR